MMGFGVARYCADDALQYDLRVGGALGLPRVGRCGRPTSNLVVKLCLPRNYCRAPSPHYSLAATPLEVQGPSPKPSS